MDQNELIEIIKRNDIKVDFDIVRKAIEFAIKYHGSQLRASGAPYYSHPLEVAAIIADMHLDTASIVTAILHDTVEDTELTVDDIKKHFGSNIAHLVDGVTKLTRLQFEPTYVQQAENFRKLLLAISEDIRVLLVKLADRLHNMRTIEYIKTDEKRKRIAMETMEIYAPLAERIGMHQIKTELQDLAFHVLHKKIRESILDGLNSISYNRQSLIQHIIDTLHKDMEENDVHCDVFGRQKTPYSIWMKMNQKNVTIDQLSDIIAFRIIAANVQDCYKVLGIVHQKYKMVPGSFQDFISTPKNNGYQSIHTNVIGPMQQRIEIQIRTEEMHYIAEMGVAAHWKYKQKYSSVHDGKQFKWLRELLQILDQTSDPKEFLENTKLAMYYDQVFCFTPKGNLIQLPKGSTPVDFAYAVHSDVGHHCCGSKVNGQLVPLRTLLSNGDQVEILTNKHQVPSAAWEDFVVTGKAKSAISKFIKQQQSHQYVILGKSILEKAFQQVGIRLESIDYKLATQKFNKKTIDDLYCAVGEGIISRNDIVKLYHDATKFSNPFALLKFKKHKESSHAVPIKGLIDGMAIHYARCCHPIPGDSIIGIIHSGKGMMIHTSNCSNLKHLTSNKHNEHIYLVWEDGVQQSFVGRLKITIANISNGLANICNEVAKHHSSITNIKVLNRKSDSFEIHLDVLVSSIEQLEEIINGLNAKKEVFSVDRD